MPKYWLLLRLLSLFVDDTVRGVVSIPFVAFAKLPRRINKEFQLVFQRFLSNRENGSVPEFSEGRDALWLKRSSRWVIVVDDEEPIRQAVGQFLFDRGYQVTTCADAATGLKLAKSKLRRMPSDVSGGPAVGEQTDSIVDYRENRNVPDAIISDIRMPKMDGLEFLREIRADPHLMEIPVVLLTAKSMTQDRIEGYKAGADSYLLKPFDPEELLAIIDKSIDRHETLNGKRVTVDDLKQELREIKFLLSEKGGAGAGNGWVEATNVFLSPDERKILELLCKGLKTKEIAEQSYISTRRVVQHLHSMCQKANIRNRTELVRWAVRTGNVVLE